MAFYEKQKRKQVTSGYKIKMSGLHHGLLWLPSSWGFAEASPMQRREIRPTCSGSSTVLNVEENCCEAVWRPSATCSP